MGILLEENFMTINICLFWNQNGNKNKAEDKEKKPVIEWEIFSMETDIRTNLCDETLSRKYTKITQVILDLGVWVTGRNDKLVCVHSVFSLCFPYKRVN